MVDESVQFESWLNQPSKEKLWDFWSQPGNKLNDSIVSLERQKNIFFSISK